MSVAFLMRCHEPTKVPGFEWMEGFPALKQDQVKSHTAACPCATYGVNAQIVYIGLRDLDVAEQLLLKQLNVKAFTMQHIDRFGIGKVMEMSLDYLSKQYGESLHLSVDIDSVDPQLAPSTGTKASVSYGRICGC